MDIWTNITQSAINGLMIGGVYALIAVGLTLIFGVMGIVNFAQGEFLMLGMYATWLIWRAAHINAYALFFVTAPLMFGFGYLVFRGLIARVVGKGDVMYILLTIGLSIFLQNVMLLIFTSDYQVINDPIKAAALHLGPLSFPAARVISFAAAVLLVAALNWVINRTALGRAMRACAENREVATLLGIDTASTYAIAFGIGSLLAGAAGALLSPVYYIYPGIGNLFGTTAFVVVVLGGMGSVVGALLGGLVIGVVEALTGNFVSLDLQSLGTFLIFLLVLFFRPNGILGKGATVK